MLNHAIITGGTGFIGRWMVNELLNNGVRVTAIVRDSSKIKKEWLDNKLFRFIDGDICELSSEQFTDKPYDAFFHFAWNGVATQAKNDFELQIKNIELSLKALELCHDIGCKKFIAAGTVAEYVFCKDVMNVEEKQTPNDMYGAAKTSAHYFLHVRAMQLQQPFIWAVIPSTFGEHRKDNNIITYTIRTLLKGEKPKYGALTQMWDFLYVTEVARALRLIAEKGNSGMTYGIGSGIYKPLKEYIVEIRNLIDPSLPLGIGEYPQMTKQTFSSCVNISDLIRDTGFYPQVAFEDGIKKTIDYWRNYENLQKI